MKQFANIAILTVSFFVLAGNAAAEKHEQPIGISKVIDVKFKIVEGEKSQREVGGSVTNGERMPLSLTTQTAYVAEAKMVGGNVTLTPGSVTTGLLITVTPSMRADGSIELALDYSESSLDAMPSVKSGDLEIQVPSISGTKVQTKVVVGNGKELSIPFGPVSGQRKLLVTASLAK